MQMASTMTHFCKLCSRSLTDPRLLPCLHVFCKSCLESLQSQNEGTLTCPTCYKTSPHPPADLPRHLRMEREIASSRVQGKGEMMCGSCENKNKAEAYCEDCSSGVCSTCIDLHKQLKVFKGHKVIPLNSTQLYSIPVKPVSCTAHPCEVVKYYCTSCSILVCSECIFDHKEHNFKRLEEAGKEERAELQSVLSEVEKAIPPIAEAIERINGIVKHTCTNGNKAEKEVEEAFRQITAAVEKRRVELVQEVKSSVASKTTQLELQKEGLEKIMEGLQHALECGRVACKEYSAVEVLATKASIHQASKNLLEHSCSTDLHPVNNGSLRVAVDTSDVIEMVSTLGSVHENHAPYPPHCSLVGINPQLAIGVAKDCGIDLTLQTRDNKGEDITVGGAKAKGRFFSASSKSEVNDCVVNDLDNGRYVVRIDSHTEGEYQLHISIDDGCINGSPFTVNVRDYTAITSPVAKVPTNDHAAYVDIGHNNLQYVSLDGSVQIYNNGSRKEEIPCSKFGSTSLRGIAVDEQNEVMFVVGAGANQVIKASLDGEVITSVGKKGSGELEFNFPMGLCLTEEGLLLVADNSNKRVQVLGSNFSFIRSIPCQSVVYGVSVDSCGNVHAAAGNRVEVFSINGDKVSEYGKGVLHQAGDVAFLNSQSMYSFVTDNIDGKVFVFEWSKNALIHSFPAGKNPIGITVNQEGMVLVCCWSSNEFMKF